MRFSPSCQFASVIAARTCSWPCESRHKPSPALASGVSAVLLTVKRRVTRALNALLVRGPLRPERIAVGKRADAAALGGRRPPEGRRCRRSRHRWRRPWRRG